MLAVAGSVAVAGCSSTEDVDGDEEGDAELLETDAFTAPSVDGGGNVSWLRIDVENRADAPHGRLEVGFEVTSADGTVIERGSRVASYLPPADALRLYVAGDFEMEEFDAVEAEIVAASARPERSRLEEATVSDTELSVGGDLINVTGELDVGDLDADRIAVVAPLYDADGRLRGTGLDVLYDPSGPEPVEFGANGAGFRAPEGSAPIDSYDVLVFDDGA